jgi:hypothetical protein
MECADFEYFLSEYIEESVDRRIAAEMHKHQSGCSACRMLHSQVSGVLDDLRSFPEVDPPQHLVQRILEKTSGTPRHRSFWQAIVVPTFRPFLTQRFAAATAIVFVFLSMTVSLLGPGFSSATFSTLSPSAVYRQADNLVYRTYRRVLRFNQWTKEVRAELYMWGTDLSSRIDSQIISALFRSYDEGVQQGIKKQKGGNPQPQKTEPKKEPRKSDQKSHLPVLLAKAEAGAASAATARRTFQKHAGRSARAKSNQGETRETL